MREKNPSATEVVLAHLKARHSQDPNIEAVLSYLRTLSSVISDGDMHDVTLGALSDLEAAACKAIVDIACVSLPDGDTPYHRLAAWTQAASGQVRVEFFTTNYDLLLEQALERFRVPYFDGFVGSAEPFFDLAAIENDILPQRWTKVWKLHGSVNWHQGEGRAFRTGLGERPSSLLIYPSHLKYDESRRLPYVAMADRLLAFLRQDKATLITCGFSFADEHLNDLIDSGLRANGSAALFALMYGSFNNKLLISKLATSRTSVSAYFSDHAIIGGIAGAWNSVGLAHDAPRSSLVRWNGDAAEFSGGDFSVFGDFLGLMANYQRFETPSAAAAGDDGAANGVPTQGRVEASEPGGAI